MIKPIGTVIDGMECVTIVM